nr:EOG090X0689 [Eurycercus lamellatus]
MFFSTVPADKLWKGVTSVSNSGKKRGRGKGMGKKISKNLNKGQVIGVGKMNMVWPGLNSPVLQGRELIQQRKLPEDPEYQSKLSKLRDGMGQFSILKLSPLERGWSGTKMPGRSLGPPDPIGEDNFEGFDTIVLEFKTVFNMKGNLGRVRTMSAFVVTGNGNGLAGFALGKAQMGNSALRKAKNRAGQKLMYVERYNNHTVMHDFFTRFGRVRIFVTKKPEGHGLVCHRAIKEICKAVGIKDLYAKVEGPTKNIQSIAKAFMIGLLNQASPSEILNDGKLNIWKLDNKFNGQPTRLAFTSSRIQDRRQMSFLMINQPGRIPLMHKDNHLESSFPVWEFRFLSPEPRRDSTLARILK